MNFYTLLIATLLAGSPVTAPDSTHDKQVYRIDEPGTITFTVGVTIKGKVEKPQVVIFLPKEKTLYRDIPLTRDFRKELLTPPVFEPKDTP